MAGGFDAYQPTAVLPGYSTLVVPGQNDSAAELRDIARFIAGVSPDMPWHISRFSPQISWRLKNNQATGEDLVYGACAIGKQARLMSQALRKLTAIVAKSKTVVIFINQIRMQIGVMFGNPETTTGGNALKFYASVRLDVRQTAAQGAGVALEV